MTNYRIVQVGTSDFIIRQRVLWIFWPAWKSFMTEGTHHYQSLAAAQSALDEHIAWRGSKESVVAEV